MTKTCPYCGGVMANLPPMPAQMTPKQHAIYQAVLKAGPNGIPRDELLRKVGGTSPTSIRTLVCRINKATKPLEIYSRHKTYFIQV